MTHELWHVSRSLPANLVDIPADCNFIGKLNYIRESPLKSVRYLIIPDLESVPNGDANKQAIIMLLTTKIIHSTVIHYSMVCANDHSL